MLWGPGTPKNKPVCESCERPNLPVALIFSGRHCIGAQLRTGNRISQNACLKASLIVVMTDSDSVDARGFTFFVDLIHRYLST